MGTFEQLATYLSYPFVVNALVVGVLVTLCSSLLGTTLVMKRLSYFAAAIGVLCAFVGMLASIVLGTPVGSTIVVLDALAYALFCLAGWLKRRK